MSEVTVAPKVTPEDVENEIVAEQYDRIPNTNVTICTLTLANGLTAVGVNQGSVDPRNYSEKIGKEYARKGAVEKIWPMLGARLADKLSLIRKAGKPSGKICDIGHPQTAVGTKVVHFVAMTRGEYNIYRGWQLPADENGDDNGYLVEYTDGGEPNVVDHTGYVSWSPTAVFENAYSVSVRQNPETFLDRMIKERDELQEKYDGLHRFLTSGGLNKIPSVEGADLTEQYELMKLYLHVLNRRIARNTL